jgi:hypothetical protein
LIGESQSTSCTTRWRSWVFAYKFCLFHQTTTYGEFFTMSSFPPLLPPMSLAASTRTTTSLLLPSISLAASIWTVMTLLLPPMSLGCLTQNLINLSSQPNSFQSMIMVRGWCARQYGSPYQFLCRGVYAHQRAANQASHACHPVTLFNCDLVRYHSRQ